MDLHEEMKIAERKLEAQTTDLIHEFQAHFEEYVALHPEDTGRKREVFEAWAIQKIAGLQLAITQLAEWISTIAGTDDADQSS